MLEHTTIRTNGIQLHVVQAGPPTGPPVILLHGFPEFWYGWRRQIPALAAAGFRVWAPDQRGYNLSEKPSGIAAYTLDELGADLLGLIQATGREKVFVVGHDWGGALTWWLADRHPEKIERAVVLNSPYPTAFVQVSKRSPRQMFRTWYVMFFKIPWLPEALLRRKNWKTLVRSLEKTSRSGAFTADDFEQYRQAWSQPDAFRAMINWYRAASFRTAKSFGDHIAPPTLLLWGARDTAFVPKLAERSIECCRAGQLRLFPDATHWVQHEEAEQVNESILGFFQLG